MRMKAVVFHARNQPLQLEEVKMPIVGPDEVLVQVMACGADITDWKIIDGFAYIPKLPIVLGHETAGVVAKVGSQVTNFKPGDRVAVYNYFYCGKCPYCRDRREQLCLEHGWSRRNTRAGWRLRGVHEGARPATRPSAKKRCLA